MVHYTQHKENGILVKRLRAAHACCRFLRLTYNTRTSIAAFSTSVAGAGIEIFLITVARSTGRHNRVRPETDSTSSHKDYSNKDIVRDTWEEFSVAMDGAYSGKHLKKWATNLRAQVGWPPEEEAPGSQWPGPREVVGAFQIPLESRAIPAGHNTAAVVRGKHFQIKIGNM